MDKSPIVTIVVPTFNAKDCVVNTLESIRNQDYQNIELIVCDDCSTDSTSELVWAYYENFVNCFYSFKIFISEKNQGTIKNLYHGYSNAIGKYIKPLGQGDLLAKNNTITSMVLYSEAEKIKVMFGLALPFSTNEESCKFDNYIIPEPYFCNEYENSEKLLINTIGLAKYISGTVLFFRTDILLNKNYTLPDKIKYCEDLVQVIYGIEKQKINFYNDIIVYYENTSGISTATGFYSNAKMLNDHKEFYKYLLNKKLPKKTKNMINLRLLTLKTKKKLFRELIWIMIPKVFFLRLKRKLLKKKILIEREKYLFLNKNCNLGSKYE